MKPSTIRQIKVGSLLKYRGDPDLDEILEGKSCSDHFSLCVVTKIKKSNEWCGGKYYEVQWFSGDITGSGVMSFEHFSKKGLYELVN